MRISDWSPDVCSSDLPGESIEVQVAPRHDLASGRTKLGFDRLFVDPVTVHILGKRQWGEVRFDRVHLLPMINRLHRSLLLPGRWGNWLLGGVAIAWLGLTLMGIYMTLPLARSMRDKRGARAHRSEERRVGKECVSTCRSRGTR